MIKSKKTKINKRTTQQVVQDKEHRFMAHIKNYKCLFCQRTLYVKNFDNVKCTNCNSQWIEKLSDKKVKQVDAI